MTAGIGVVRLPTELMESNRETAKQIREIADRLEKGEFESVTLYAINKGGKVDEIRNTTQTPEHDAGVLMCMAMYRIGYKA